MIFFLIHWTIGCQMHRVVKWHFYELPILPTTPWNIKKVSEKFKLKGKWNLHYFQPFLLQQMQVIRIQYFFSR